MGRVMCVSVLAALLVMTRGSVSAQVRSGARLTSAEAAQVLTAECNTVKTTGAFPEALKIAFRDATKLREFSLADPGENYQATDVITDRKLPWRRLVFAGQCGKYWVVYYERGGFAHSYGAVVFEPLSTRAMRLVWGGQGGSRAKDWEELNAEVSSREMREDAKYY
jgi:hypothetical protein